MDFIENFIPRSKAQLLQVALWYHKGDVGKAQEMVDYYTKNIDLPDYDPMPPSFMDNSKAMVNGIMSWVRENQDTLSQGYEFIRQVIQNKGALPQMNVPQATMPPQSVNPLPPINE